MFTVILKIVFVIGSVAAASLLLAEAGIRFFGFEDAAWVGIACFGATSIVGATVAELLDWFQSNRIKVVQR